MFTDSSKSIYGFNCYCRSIEDNKICCNLLFSKAKNAPSKSKTLPTLELLAVYLALKCLFSLLNSINAEKVLNITIGIDAQIVLSWILSKNVKTKNIFAKNRVRDISVFRNKFLENWGLKINFRYVPTNLNVADMLTKPMTVKSFKEGLDVWQHGPLFIREEPVFWPDKNLGCLSADSKILTKACVVSDESPLINVKLYSDFHKIVKITVYVLKFLYALRKYVFNEQELFEKAKIHLFRSCQREFFKDESDFLLGKCQNSIPARVKNLNMFIDCDGLIRSRGRLGNCPAIGENINNPIVLPVKNHLVNLLILDLHGKCKHLGCETTLVALRNAGFWLPKGRLYIKSILKNCIICKRFNAHAFAYPKSSDYPMERVNFQSPFLFTGFDFTGHIFVKFNSECVKMYVLLFTCLNVRAVHLELLPSMSSNQFLQAFIRFTNAYRIPKVVYSDNQSTFLNSINIVSGCKVDSDFSKFLIENSIKHATIPVYSAWFGGAWERMVGLMKRTLHKVVGRRKLDYFYLLTVLSDIQTAINNRPLCHVSNDDLNSKIITPNSFLKCDSGKNLVISGTEVEKVNLVGQEELAKALDDRLLMLENFKDLWYEEYLLSLREAGKERYQKIWENVIKVGDIVLVTRPNKVRAEWSFGRVTELCPGKDGKVRVVKVAKPDRSISVYPINLLYPMELSVTPLKKSAIITESNSEISPSSVPRRLAAKKCLDKLRKCN